MNGPLCSFKYFRAVCLQLYFYLTFTSIYHTFHCSFLRGLYLFIVMSKTFSASDVAAHKKPDDLWIIVDKDVYDMTKFQTEHPGKSSTLRCS